MVTQNAEGKTPASADRFFQAGDGGDHPSALQPFGGMVLVVDGDVQQIGRAFSKIRHGLDEPCSEAVGVRRDLKRDPLAWFVGIDEGGQLPEEFCFEHADILHMAAEPFSLFCRRARRASDDEDDAETLFELLHALRNGRRGHVQGGRSSFEAACLDNGRDGAKSGIVEHGLVSLNLGKLD
jgi:hypothetical protein